MKSDESKRLTRSSRDRMIAGVCGGMAQYFSFDSSLMRIIWVVLALMGGMGFLLYLAALLIIPLDEEKPTEKKSPRPDSKSVWGIILILLGFFFLIGSLNWRFFNWMRYEFWGFFWPLVVIFIGIVLILYSLKKSPVGDDSGIRKCSRLRNQRIFLGVAGGTGRYFNLDLNLARLLWVCFILFSGGMGLIVYLILYFVLPEEPLQEPPAGDNTTQNEQNRP